MNTHKMFYESWVYESPFSNNIGDTLSTLITNIKSFSKFYPTVDINNGFKKCEGDQLVYYWFENNGNIILAVEATKSPQAIKINLTGKNKNFNSPYASKLYAAILQDQHKPIQVRSDTQLSNDGLKIWKNLIRDGFTIGIYDNQAPGRTYKKLSSPEELDNFFSSTDQSYDRYQYIIGEAIQFLNVNAWFGIRRLYELSGDTLDKKYFDELNN
jgi:hypothetical protein